MVMDRLAKLLGVKYSVSDLKNLLRTATGQPRRKGKKAAQTDVSFPLALLLNPQVLEVLRNAARGMSLRSSDKSDLSALDVRTYREIMQNKIEDAVRDFNQDLATTDASNA